MLEIVPVVHDPHLVGLAVALAIFASYTALDLAQRMHSTYSAAAQNVWMCAAATTLGVGIWAMHFIAMIAFNTPYHEYYNTAWTVASAIVPIIVSGLSFWLVKQNPREWLYLLLAGILLGCAIAAMHYTGMAALMLPGIKSSYDRGHVFASVLIAIITATIALFLAFWRPNFRYRFGAAILMGLGISSMHFTAISALTLCATAGTQLTPVSEAFEEEPALAFWIALVAGLVFGFALIISVFDKRIAKVQAEQRSTLRYAQKMEAIGQLTGGIAHDFNNLLMVIGGSLDMLEKGRDPEKRYATMRQAITRGQGLTRQLLAFARRQPLAPKPIHVPTHLLAAKELFARSLRGNVTLKLDFPEDLWPIDVDIDAFDMALLNLSVNARDAMPNGGSLKVTATNLSLRPSTLAHRTGLLGDCVRINVEDTGCGMPGDVLQRVFEPFFTTKEVGQGTGLGLAQVWGFMRQSSGAVLIDSAVGHGTSVQLFFPRCHKEPEIDAHTALAFPTTVAEPRGTVLLVEDDVTVAEVSSAFFDQLGFKVWYAASASQALDLLAKGELPTLLFTNLLLQDGVGGVELARQVSHTYPELPILLTTGYTPEADDAHKLDFPLIQKPYTLYSLSNAVEQLLPQPAVTAVAA